MIKWELGDIAICQACGKEIIYKDPYWEHTGQFTPRHIAKPGEPISSSRLEILRLEINKLELKPTDMLVVKFPEDTHWNEIDFLRNEINKVLPEGVSGIVLRGDIQIYTISKGEES